VLEFEAALFEPPVIRPEISPEIIERHQRWLEPTLMDPVSGLMIFAFHSTIIKTPRATILRVTGFSGSPPPELEGRRNGTQCCLCNPKTPSLRAVSKPYHRVN
jgi:hypothetical protein